MHLWVMLGDMPHDFQRLVFVVYGGCAALAREYVISRPAVMRWMKRTFAATFAYLSLRLALSER